tara:strand:+ start:4217 stop:4804 length:588 start_codon:yes stop_codon:yes gene_type:complete
MIKAIIFDMDGTLIRLPINYDIIFKKLQNLFDTRDEFKPLIPKILEKSNGDMKLIQQSFDLICEEETQAVKKFEIMNNAIEVLNYFKNKNYSLSLVTMQCESVAKSVLDKMQISHLFSNIITRDNTYERSLQIKTCINFLSLPSNDVMVVGDRIHDVKSAKQVGCTPILCNKDKIDSFNECVVISELSELLKINL